MKKAKNIKTFFLRKFLRKPVLFTESTFLSQRMSKTAIILTTPEKIANHCIYEKDFSVVSLTLCMSLGVNVYHLSTQQSNRFVR